jgi:hypothetical protein
MLLWQDLTESMHYFVFEFCSGLQPVNKQYLNVSNFTPNQKSVIGCSSTGNNNKFLIHYAFERMLNAYAYMTCNV